MDRISTVHQIIDFFKNDLTGIRFTKSSFCIVGFTDGKVKIRFVASAYMGYNLNKYLQLGFELPAKKEALQLFSDSDNFYPGKFKNGL